MKDEEIRRRLEKERADLERLREQIRTEQDLDEAQRASTSELSPADQHPADMGTETFEREKELTILEQVESGLRDVDHAFRRLEDGEYGRCEACGQPIGRERLQAIPTARFCVDDQKRQERGGTPAG